VTERKIEEVEKTYNGQAIKKIRFIVADPNEESKSERYFDVGKRSARLIIAKLKRRTYTSKARKNRHWKRDTLYTNTSNSELMKFISYFLFLVDDDIRYRMRCLIQLLCQLVSCLS